MAQGSFIAYYRVSTAQQGRSGLGLEAQQQAVRDYLNGGRWELLREFVEVESGKRADRPELVKALAACRAHRATLVLAKLDRLSRNAAFLLNLRDAGVDFVAADMPTANRLTVGIMALVAEEEARMISARTKAALAAAKARGTVLGGARAGAADRARGLGAKGTAALQAKADARAADLAPMIEAWWRGGITSQAGLARALNTAGIPAARGGKWSNVQVAALLPRIGATIEASTLGKALTAGPRIGDAVRAFHAGGAKAGSRIGATMEAPLLGKALEAGSRIGATQARPETGHEQD